jgi:DNA-binding NarL/FixJ family response regulator
MLKKLTRIQNEQKQAAQKLLALQVTEIEEISEKLFTKMEEKMKSLRDIEARLDRKIAVLEELMQRVEKAEISSNQAIDSRYREITDLAAQGLNIDAIAGVLDIPKGEIELILSLRK